MSIRITLLGSIDLRHKDGLPVSSVLQQPKRLALLAYLAVEADKTPVRRERVVSLFWPDQPDARGSHALSQAAHYLRRSLGDCALVGRGTEGIGLDTDYVSCDATEFLAAAASGDAARALSLYGGELLPGFHLADAPDFMRWLDDEKTRQRQAACELAWSLAESEAERGATVSAARMAQRAADLGLDSEMVVRRQIELLVRLGDRSAALEAFEQLKRRLAQTYGSVPTHETMALARRILASGANRGEPDFDSTATLPQSTVASPRQLNPSQAESRASARTTTQRRRPVARWTVLVVVASLLVITSAYASVVGRRRVERPAAIRTRILIEPFRDYSTGVEDSNLAAAITNEVLAEVGQVSGLESVAADFADPGTLAAHETPTVALRAGVLRSNGRLRVSAVMLDNKSGIALNRTSMDLPLADAALAVHQAGAGLSDFVRLSLGTRLWPQRFESESHAEKLVRTAIEDRLRSDSLRQIGVHSIARIALRSADSMLAQAEKLAPGWDQPPVQRAETALHLMWLQLLQPAPDYRALRRGIAEGLRHANRAIDKPNHDVAAIEVRGILYQWLWLTAPSDSASTTEIEQAIQDLRRVVAAVPTQARAWSALSGIYYQRGDFADAYWAAERAYRADTYLVNTPDILALLFSSALETGDHDAATRWCAELDRRRPQDPVGEWCTLGLLAWRPRLSRADARQSAQILDGAAATPEPWRNRLALLSAVTMARVGLKDSARTVLRRVDAQPSADPELLPIRAWLLACLGQRDSANAQLDSYVRAKPHARAGIATSRRFQLTGDTVVP